MGHVELTRDRRPLSAANCRVRRSAIIISPVGISTQWQKAEYRLQGVPAVANPFDPDMIRVDVQILSPAGVYLTVPAFWYEPFTRAEVNGVEVVTSAGPPEWRFRFTPTVAGTYRILVTVPVRCRRLTRNFHDERQPLWRRRLRALWLRACNATSGQSFQETTDGSPLPLIGTDVCWDDGPGYAEFSLWFQQMAAAGENFARVWMCPWTFGIETDANTLTNYRLDRAWQLDNVFDLANQNGISIQLCLDYAGMFQILPDSWGGDNSWPQNPYNAENGGMCAVPDEFFTSGAAQHTYEKRLRYLIARYGYATNLLSWELYNEIDDAYQTLTPADENPWFSAVSAWLKASDPFHHLVTTSYVNANQPAVWSLPSIDYVQIHPYAEASPAQFIASTATQLQAAYGKPVLVAEFGMSLTGWNRSSADPFLRGFRQAVWGAALGGSTGTAMSWWWQDVYSEDDQTIYAALKALLGPTSWQTGASSSSYIPSVNQGVTALGDAIPGGQPFSVQIPLNSQWGPMLPGSMAVPNAGAASQGPNLLNAFVQGAWHPDLVCPFQVAAWFAPGGSFTMHLNGASVNAEPQILVDGVLVYTNTFSGDGQVDEEYNLDIRVPVPAGKHQITVRRIWVPTGSSSIGSRWATHFLLIRSERRTPS